MNVRAQKLGIGEVPVILCDEWTPAQVKAFRLLVNRSVTWAEWDEELWLPPRPKSRSLGIHQTQLSLSDTAESGDGLNNGSGPA
jgi:hypothetical protein